MKSNILEMLEFLCFVFVFFKRIGHVNAITVYDVCLRLGNFKCFYTKIFLYISEYIFLDNHRSYFKPFFLPFGPYFFLCNFFKFVYSY